ncbi:acylphosphatase [Chitinimonas sp.]|uniref:acylphosphatase n=1 Tax=Chitinimonas sp. TaxID=1934313 RepID=UPI0035B3063A
MKAYHLLIKGHVQGVGYRNAMEWTAHRLGVKGWVRNRKEGTVEAVVEGNDASVARLLKWCWQGPPNAYVTAIEETEQAPEGLQGFVRKPTV